MKLKEIVYDNTTFQTSFIETVDVKDGVKCDVYSFDSDDSKNLGVLSILAGKCSPCQRVLQGDETLQIHVSGKATLVITEVDGAKTDYKYPGAKEVVAVRPGQVMQWFADEDLQYYEICTPPFGWEV